MAELEDKTAHFRRMPWFNHSAFTNISQFAISARILVCMMKLPKWYLQHEHNLLMSTMHPIMAGTCVFTELYFDVAPAFKKYVFFFFFFLQ